jgi:hypothetical protein
MELTLYISNIPAIATDKFVVIFILPTTCFGPYGPSSGQIQQQQHLYFESAIDTITDPLFYNCSLIGVSLVLSIYNYHY